MATDYHQIHNCCVLTKVPLWMNWHIEFCVTKKTDQLTSATHPIQYCYALILKHVFLTQYKMNLESDLTLPKIKGVKDNSWQFVHYFRLQYW